MNKSITILGSIAIVIITVATIISIINMCNTDPKKQTNVVYRTIDSTSVSLNERNELMVLNRNNGSIVVLDSITTYAVSGILDEGKYRLNKFKE